MKIFEKILIFLFLLIDIGQSQGIENCLWNQLQSETLGQWIDYLRFFRKGKCRYTVRYLKIQQNLRNMKTMTILIKNIQDRYNNKNILLCNLKQEKEQIFNCSYNSQQNMVQNNEKIKNFDIHTKQNNKITILLKYYSQVINLTLQMEKKYFQIQITLINIKQDETFSIQKLQNITNLILLPGIYFILALIITNKPLLTNYTFLHISLLINIIISVIQNYIKQIYISFQIQINIFLYIILFITNFVLLAFILKFVFNFVRNQPESFQFNKKTQIISQNSSIFQQTLPTSSSNLFKNNFSSKICLNFVGFFQQKNISSRIILVFVILFYQTLGKIQYQLISLFLDLIFFVIIPMLTLFYQINPTTQILNESSFLSSDLSLLREQLILPIQRISVLFILTFIQFFTTSTLTNICTTRSFFQIFLILSLFVFTLYIASSVLKNKIGKSVRIYKHGYLNKNSYCLKILKYFQRKSQDICQYVDVHEICSICLQKLDYSSEVTRRKCIETQCKHIFHAQCLSSWVKNKMICPIDRNYLNRQQTLKYISQAIQNK